VTLERQEIGSIYACNIPRFSIIMTIVHRWLWGWGGSVIIATGIMPMMAVKVPSTCVADNVKRKIELALLGHRSRGSKRELI